MDRQPFISIIIPVHNGSKYLNQCLDALTVSSYQSYEIIVVDDASTDDSAEISRKKGVTVLQLPHQSGPAAARNYGAQKAQGDILFFVDSDVVVQRETIARVADNFQNNQDIATKKIILPCIIIALLLLPIIFVTLKYSQTNVRWIFRKSLSSRIELSNLLYHLKALWKYHLTLPVLILSLVSIGVSVYRKDKRAIIFLIWIAGYYLLITYTGANNSPRYSIYWIPAFCILTATAVDFFHYRRWKVLISTILIVIAGYQFVIAFHSEPTYAEGYEEAARYVVENRKGESVLFSSSADTGYFVFFARKHNPNKDLIVLRADKILVTSRISRIIEERIKNREAIYEILRDFGTCYVVIEDKEFKSPPLEWLREEVKSDRFILRKRIPIHSNSNKLRDVALDIYEYKEYTPPKRGKKLQMNIPLMGDSISVEFDDLLHNKYTNRMK